MQTVIARLERGGKKFEIYVYSERAYSYREGKKVDISSILAVDQIFTDARRGIKASSQDLRKVFGTDDVLRVAEVILRDGEVQLTAEYRKRLQEERLNWIVSFIHKNFVDPRTGLPHPESRIRAALKEAKVKIDPLREPETQVNRVLEKVRRVLPLKTGTVTMRVRIGPSGYGRLRSFLASQGKILTEKWASDGSEAVIVVEIPVGSRLLVLERIGEAGGTAEVVEEGD